MTMLEDQISALLKAAPGEPPVSLDADVLLDAQALRRGRLLAPLLVAATVAAVAVGVAVATRAGHPSRATGPANFGQGPGPHATAIAQVTAALDHAPMPPGAQAAQHHILVGGATSGGGSVDEVRRSRIWTAPGTLEQAIAYVKAHPPSGLRPGCTCGGPGAGARWIFFRSNRQHPVEVDYQFRAYQGGVAIQVDAWTDWVPLRPAWSYVGGSLMSVDVTVLRQGLQPQYAGAPTVTRTLGGAPAARLAAAFDKLPAQAQYTSNAGHPAPVVEAINRAVFRTGHGDIVVVERPYSLITITSPTHRGTAYLGGDFGDPVLRALGLPSNYGMTRGVPHKSGGLTLPPVSRSAAEAVARRGIDAPHSAPTFSTLMTVAAFEKTFGVLLSTLPGDRPVWVVTVHAPARTDGGPGTAPITRDVYSIVIDATTGTSRDDCTGCDWVKADH
jgi:hypothetical protein